jgi:hypothetical protein
VTLRVNPKVSIVLLVDREVDALDGLLAALRNGPISPRQYDALEERAQGIGDRLRDAFRKGKR